MDPVQVYETTIFNRERAGEGFHFVSVPARSFAGGEVPSPPDLARMLGLRDTVTRDRTRDRAEPWMLPFIIDAALGHDPDFPYWFEYEPPFRRGRREPTAFAQYLAFEPLIPFESSPQRPHSLTQLATTAAGIGGTGTGIAYAAVETHPILFVLIPLGIVVAGPALGAGVVGFQAAVYHLHRLLGLPDDDDDNGEGGGTFKPLGTDP